MNPTTTDQTRDRFSRYVSKWNETGCRVTISIVGCGCEKASTPSPARDLYRGDLTSKRIQIATALDPEEWTAGTPWFILSALHGIVAPSAVLDPYDVTVKTADRAALVSRVRRQLVSIGAEHGLTIIVEAGAAYRMILVEASEGLDVRVVEGRTCQMVGYAKQTGRRILDWHDDMNRRADGYRERWGEELYA